MAEETTYTLKDLVSRLGAADEAEARLLIEGISDAELIAKGADIGTPRLVKELARNYGTFADWLPKATKEQEGLLGFVDLDWLRIAAWCGRQAESLHEQHKQGASQGMDDKVVREATAADLETKARSARDRLRTALRQLSGGMISWATKIDNAASANVGASPTAAALTALADVGDAMLKDKSPGMVARRAKSKVTAKVLTEHRALAADLAKAVKKAGAVKAAAPVQQAEVDHWDGIAITFFEQFVEAVDAARVEDPRIPAASIIGLRSWFRRGGRSGGATEGTEGEKKGGEGGG